MLEPGEWVEGEIVRTIDVYDIPNEFEGHKVITANPGVHVRVLYRGGQWCHVRARPGRTDSGAPRTSP